MLTIAEEFEEEFAVWGIDPLWREPDEEGNERIIYWVRPDPSRSCCSHPDIGIGPDLAKWQWHWW